MSAKFPRGGGANPFSAIRLSRLRMTILFTNSFRLVQLPGPLVEPLKPLETFNLVAIH